MSIPNRPHSVVNQDPFANPTFRRHFDEAHASNLARRLPEPPPPPAPGPHRGRKTLDTRTINRPEPVYGSSLR